MEGERSMQDSRPMEMRAMNTAELSASIPKKEKDSIVQLRNEFKAAIRDIRNDVCHLISNRMSKSLIFLSRCVY